jgi:L-ascorbate metabolism protein UlaG (beta-lactamase superfamily)
MSTLRRRFLSFDANAPSAEKNQSNFQELIGTFNMKKHFVCALALVAIVNGTSAFAQGKGELLWLGQAAFKITTLSGKVIVIDPWLRANPTTPAEYKNLEALGKVDLILVTHGHLDHVADAPALALAHKARVFSGDLNSSLAILGVLPPELAPRMNKSGTVHPFPDQPKIAITGVKAEHSSVYVWTNPATGKQEVHPGGEAMGFIITLENGTKIYHAGDTGLFGDMKFIGEYYKPDIALVPIGGNFTMDPSDAAYALTEWLKPKMAVPMHYGANPIAKGTLPQFEAAMKAREPYAIKIVAMKPGDKLELP